MTEFTRLKQRIENLRATGNPVPDALCIRYEELRPRIRRTPQPKKVKKASKPKQPKFYRTPEWKQLRYMILVQRGARCECCGVTPAEGAKMNVDHVIPISRAWDRRLDPTNLQVLCGSCNQGKGGRSDDWRGLAGCGVCPRSSTKLGQSRPEQGEERKCANFTTTSSTLQTTV